MGVGMTCIFFPAGANSPVGNSSIYSDASMSCKQNGNVLFYPSDLVQNAVVKAAVNIWVTSVRPLQPD